MGAVARELIHGASAISVAVAAQGLRRPLRVLLRIAAVDDLDTRLLVDNVLEIAVGEGSSCINDSHLRFRGLRGAVSEQAPRLRSLHVIEVPLGGLQIVQPAGSLRDDGGISTFRFRHLVAFVDGRPIQQLRDIVGDGVLDRWILSDSLSGRLHGEIVGDFHLGHIASRKFGGFVALGAFNCFKGIGLFGRSYTIFVHNHNLAGNVSEFSRISRSLIGSLGSFFLGDLRSGRGITRLGRFRGGHCQIARLGILVGAPCEGWNRSLFGGGQLFRCLESCIGGSLS